VTPYQRRILTTIAAEQPDDPEAYEDGARIATALVAIAMNARDQAERDHIDRQLVELEQADLVKRHGRRHVELTLDGEIAAALAAEEAQPQPDATPCNAPVATPQDAPQAPRQRRSCHPVQRRQQRMQRLRATARPHNPPGGFRGMTADSVIVDDPAARVDQSAGAGAMQARSEEIPGRLEERPDDSHPGEPIDAATTYQEGAEINTAFAPGTVGDLLLDLGGLVAMRIAEIRDQHRDQDRLPPAVAGELMQLRDMARGVIHHTREIHRHGHA